MEFSADLLFSSPMMFFGFVALVFVVGVLAAFRNGRRVRWAILGGAIGYLVLGTELAEYYGREAVRQGKCADAAWIGPAVGLLCGAIVAVVAFDIARVVAGRSRLRET